MHNIYTTGEEKLNHYLDYLEIVKLLQEFDKLKRTNFDQDQNTLFRCTLKPRFYKEEDNMKTMNLTINPKIKQDEEKNILDYGEVYESYTKIKDQENKNLVNNRLIDMFDDDLKLPFEMLRKKEIHLLNK